MFAVILGYWGGLRSIILHFSLQICVFSIYVKKPTEKADLKKKETTHYYIEHSHIVYIFTASFIKEY